MNIYKSESRFEHSAGNQGDIIHLLLDVNGFPAPGQKPAVVGGVNVGAAIIERAVIGAPAIGFIPNLVKLHPVPEMLDDGQRGVGRKGLDVRVIAIRPAVVLGVYWRTTPPGRPARNRRLSASVPGDRRGGRYSPQYHNNQGPLSPNWCGP